MPPILSRRLRPERWVPIGVEDLEPNALDVVRSNNHRTVIAGPGAGKTELLAQRAAFLLQTGGCPHPRRILAISFKRDAANNLSARVTERCHPQHAFRFDSMTFDAFAKGLVDRFGQALPEIWRPKAGYEIILAGDRELRRFLDDLGAPPLHVGTLADIRALTVKTFERKHLLAKLLQADGWSNASAGDWAAEKFWNENLHHKKNTYLTFPMIGRLAELLLRVNPMVLTALRLTYSHVFMDEFQDTTQVQYDLVRTIFLGGDTVVTAVGDNKQQIMRWANAMRDPFALIERDFHAQRTPLLSNYRSSPELVRMQHVLAQALDAHSVIPVSKVRNKVSGDCCTIWDFSSPAKEADQIARFVKKEMRVHGLKPRDFVLLVRQKAADYAAILAPAFAKADLVLRNEASQVGPVMLQDLLAEEVCEMFVTFLRFASADRAGRYWSMTNQRLCRLRGIDTENRPGQVAIATEVHAFAKSFRSNHPLPVQTEEDAVKIVTAFLELVGEADIKAMYAAYRQGDWFGRLLVGIVEHLAASCKGAKTWNEALDVFEGVSAVPLMTIHKSKGLEYHTVIFVGLDDGAWWSFSNDQVEATAGFFVAFTRAKQRVLFTYCPSRGQRKTIAALYDLLQLAGVSIVSKG